MIEDINLKKILIVEILTSDVNINLNDFNIDEILICSNNINSNLVVIVTDKIYVIEKIYSNIFNKITKIDDVNKSLINSISINSYENQIVIGFIGEGVNIYDFDDDFELWNKTNLLKPMDFREQDLFGFRVMHSENNEIIVSSPNKSVFINDKEYKNAGGVYKCVRVEPFNTDAETSDYAGGGFQVYNYIIEDLKLYKKHYIDKSFIRGNRLGYNINTEKGSLVFLGINKSIFYNML